jgi:uncharacterized protein YqjF (DUF2071 family)
MAQRWHNLLFAHWPISPDLLRPLVPPPLEIDLFNGQAWLGVIPFRLTGIRLRGLPALPLVSRFNETNLRTYVTLDGKPGVYFLSMDAGNTLGTAIARPTFRVPYTNADVSITRQPGEYDFRSERRQPGPPPARFRACYRPVSCVFRSDKCSLEEWLTERYCYYSVSSRAIYRCEIAHRPWPLRRARATIEENTLAAALGIDLPDVAPHLLYAHCMDAIFWWPKRVMGVRC